MSLEKEPAGAFNKAQRLIEQLLIYITFRILQGGKPFCFRPALSGFPTGGDLILSVGLYEALS